MHFVYVLKMNGTPYYVGQTKDIIHRYRGHNNSTTYAIKIFVDYYYIRYGIVPEMQIIKYTTSDFVADSYESRIIRTCYKKGYFMLNTRHGKFPDLELMETAFECISPRFIDGIKYHSHNGDRKQKMRKELSKLRDYVRNNS